MALLFLGWMNREMRIPRIGNPYFFQKDGERTNRTVKISKRPVSMRNDMTHFAESGNDEKFPEGPEFPSPGPTLPMLVTDKEHRNELRAHEHCAKLAHKLSDTSL